MLHPFKVYFALRLLGGLGSWFSSLIINLLKKISKLIPQVILKYFFSKMPKMDSARKSQFMTDFDQKQKSLHQGSPKNMWSQLLKKKRWNLVNPCFRQYRKLQDQQWKNQCFSYLFGLGIWKKVQSLEQRETAVHSYLL